VPERDGVDVHWNGVTGEHGFAIEGGRADAHIDDADNALDEGDYHEESRAANGTEMTHVEHDGPVPLGQQVRRQGPQGCDDDAADDGGHPVPHIAAADEPQARQTETITMTAETRVIGARVFIR